MPKRVARSVRLASRLGVPVVATHPVQFLDAEDFVRTRRACASRADTSSATCAGRALTAEQYFKRQDEMAALFADIPQALENSMEVARRCNLAITLGKSRPRLPDAGGSASRSICEAKRMPA